VEEFAYVVVFFLPDVIKYNRFLDAFCGCGILSPMPEKLSPNPLGREFQLQQGFIRYDVPQIVKRVQCAAAAHASTLGREKCSQPQRFSLY
jgi:hypothetical protein